MAHSAHAACAAAPAAVPRRARRGRGRGPLAAVAAAFVLAQLLLVPPDMGLGWDETVYVSQVGGHAPAAFFSAPRARGVPLLVAPVAAWSSSTALLRVYLALLSGLALHLALSAWRGLFPVRVLALAGALFASLWITLFYGPQAMPNLWVAVGALGCAGCFLRARDDPRARAPVWAAAGCAALMAWMRPMDAVWVTAPLLVLAAARRSRRLLVALVAGLAAGSAEWVVEACTGYGGLVRRLADASRIQGGLGPHAAVLDQLRSLTGRTLCRPCDGPLPHPAAYAWWLALPLLAALGARAARRARRPAPALVALACAAAAAFPYLFLIDYAAPRFLLPAYALPALPVADGLLDLAAPARARWRPLAASLVALGLAGHLAVQYAVLRHVVDRTVADHRTWAHTAAALHRLGVRPPCILTGDQALPIAFLAGCSSAATSGPNANTTAARLAATARREPVAVLVPAGALPPAYARAWPVHRVGGLRVHVAPAARAPAPVPAPVPASAPVPQGPNPAPGPLP
ncbi:hypothetical protein ACFOOM_23830 [Streptomyces echinoruber]|uniref:Integral membrane protein n=1 Tax=Streptomyces echinoruber TaxID=68898 RepID=A0A918R3U3_9ACTN|nr:hypothetical protein [Streptomyces echinoruber]GGZ84793.1 hypothetical protein GCM10010389_23910 [Streptomyces echinoruber]